MEQDMLNEKPGKPGWKNKLDETGDLPGVVLQDKNAAWEKLHSRLQGKPRRINPAWYWAAAACILFLCAIPLFTTTDQQVETVKNDNLKNITAETRIQHVSLPGKSKTIMSAEPTQQKTVINHLPVQPAAGKNKSTPNPSNEKQTIQPPVEQNYLTQAAIEVHPVENDSTLNMVAIATPIKQKLKVVHINELGEPAQQPNADQGRDYSFIQIRLIT